MLEVRREIHEFSTGLCSLFLTSIRFPSVAWLLCGGCGKYVRDDVLLSDMMEAVARNWVYEYLTNGEPMSSVISLNILYNNHNRGRLYRKFRISYLWHLQHSNWVFYEFTTTQSTRWKETKKGNLRNHVKFTMSDIMRISIAGNLKFRFV